MKKASRLKCLKKSMASFMTARLSSACCGGGGRWGGVRGGGGCGGPAICPLSSGKRQRETKREEERRVALTWWSESQVSGDSFFLQMVATFRLQSPVCATRLDTNE